MIKWGHIVKFNKGSFGVQSREVVCISGSEPAAGLTEVQHGGGEGVGSMVGQQADLPLPLLLLDPQLGPPVPVRAAAAEQDEDGPKQPEP